MSQITLLLNYLIQKQLLFILKKVSSPPKFVLREDARNQKVQQLSPSLSSSFLRPNPTVASRAQDQSTRRSVCTGGGMNLRATGVFPRCRFRFALFSGRPPRASSPLQPNFPRRGPASDVI